jgi:hypothetical protein
MTKIVSFLMVIFLFTNCSNQSKLSKTFNCKTTSTENSKSVSDFKKNFKLDIPISWKTHLKFDEYQSELIAADTTKQLYDTFILYTSFNYGELIFDENYYNKVDSVLTATNLQKIKQGNLKFHSKPAYWYVSKGKKNNFDYQQFNVILKLSDDTYFNSSTEMYGNENIDERICKSIAVLETIEFLK